MAATRQSIRLAQIHRRLKEGYGGYREEVIDADIHFLLKLLSHERKSTQDQAEMNDLQSQRLDEIAVALGAWPNNAHSELADRVRELRQQLLVDMSPRAESLIFGAQERAKEAERELSIAKTISAQRLRERDKANDELVQAVQDYLRLEAWAKHINASCITMKMEEQVKALSAFDALAPWQRKRLR